MKSKIYAYSNILPHSFVEKLIDGFEVVELTDNNIKDKSFRNKNIFFITEKDFIQKIYENFLLHNNVLILLNKKDEIHKYKNCDHTTFVYGPIHVKNMNKITKNNFDKNRNCQDIKLRGDIIINQFTKQKCLLTSLEKKILLELISKGTISKEYFLEHIISVNKKAETKTAESHLTRIRKKLQEINSVVKISSRSDKFFVETNSEYTDQS